MNLDLIFAIVFYGLIFIFFLRNRDKFEIQGKIFALYRTKIGLKLMDLFAKKFRRFFLFVGYSGIVVGFLGMVLIFYTLIKGTFNLLFVSGSQPVLAPIFPGVSLPGLPALGFWHWIIAIFLLAVVHEFSHGIIARLYNIKIKSSGFAFLGPILAAFVEPDEKQMSQKSKKAQLAIFSAGPFSNIVFGLLAFLFFAFLINPFAGSLVESFGVQLLSVEEDTPAAVAGIVSGELIEEIDGILISNVDEFKDNLANLKPGDTVMIKTNVTTYTVVATENPGDSEKGFLGIFVGPVKQEFKEEVKLKYGNWFPGFIFWIRLLVYWIFIANLGVGLFNLLPLGPLDGGKMFYLASLGIFKRKKVAKKAWFLVGLLSTLLIVINLLPWLGKLLMFIFNSFISLVALLF